MSASCESSLDNGESEQSFGPALPPHLLAKNNRNKEDESQCDRSSGSSETYGPMLPPHSSVGNKQKNASGAQREIGPQIPCDLNRKVIGPEIPAHLVADEDSENESTDLDRESDDLYGPSLSLMADSSSGVSCVSSSFLKRKEAATDKKVTERETWMLELPPERAASFGMGPRQFKTKHLSEKDSDRSGWTETPTTKGKQSQVIDDSKTVRLKEISERDKEMERLVSKLGKEKKRNKSLLEIVMKKIVKKKKKEEKKRLKEGKPEVRRPFDRNIDLQVNRFDEGQKRAVLKKAQLLNNRFTQGESKFL